jgi:hypothetical protein
MLWRLGGHPAKVSRNVENQRAIQVLNEALWNGVYAADVAVEPTKAAADIKKWITANKTNPAFDGYRGAPAKGKKAPKFDEKQLIQDWASKLPSYLSGLVNKGAALSFRVPAGTTFLGDMFAGGSMARVRLQSPLVTRDDLVRLVPRQSLHTAK